MSERSMEKLDTNVIERHIHSLLVEMLATHGEGFKGLSGKAREDLVTKYLNRLRPWMDLTKPKRRVGFHAD